MRLEAPLVRTDASVVTYNPLPFFRQMKPNVNGRRAARLEQEMMTSNLGTVLDLSGTGVRLLCRRPPEIGSEAALTLRCLGQEATLRAVVVWCQKVGFLRHEMGLHFIDPTDEQRRQLTALAMVGRRRVA